MGNLSSSQILNVFSRLIKHFLKYLTLGVKEREVFGLSKRKYGIAIK